MGFNSVIKFVILVCVMLAAGTSVFAQQSAANSIKSLEVSEVDGVPVLIKHLPDWENARNGATFTNNVIDLRQTLDSRPVLDLIDFSGGTEAVTAPYPAGKLLIVEYTNAQASIDADQKFSQHLGQNPQSPMTVYRRIGNYNAFVFDAPDAAAANALLDQIKYQKTVQWLGEDPYLISRIERYFVTTTRDVFISTVLWIVSGLGISVVLGVIAGLIYFRFREHKRATMTRFSDAGGLTRLNLDDLTE